MKKWFPGNASIGITRTWHESPGDDTVAVEVNQQLGELIEINKALYNGVDERARFGKTEFTRMASIPSSVWFDLQRKGIIPRSGSFLTPEFKRWLNDPDNRFFRTRPGKI